MVKSSSVWWPVQVFSMVSSSQAAQSRSRPILQAGLFSTLRFKHPHRRTPAAWSQG